MLAAKILSICMHHMLYNIFIYIHDSTVSFSVCDLFPCTVAGVVSSFPEALVSVALVCFVCTPNAIT